MSGATVFVQICLICGRTLEVRVELLGKPVKCRHCQGTFRAGGAESQGPCKSVPSPLVIGALPTERLPVTELVRR